LASSCRNLGGDSFLIMLEAIGNTKEAQSSLQLPIVGIVLLELSFKLDDLQSCFCNLLGVVLHPLPDSGGESKGYGPNSGVEGWIEEKYCFC